MVQYISLHLVDFYGFHVGKYTRPMDPSWESFGTTPGAPYVPFGELLGSGG